MERERISLSLMWRSHYAGNKLLSVLKVMNKDRKKRNGSHFWLSTPWGITQRSLPFYWRIKCEKWCHWLWKYRSIKQTISIDTSGNRCNGYLQNNILAILMTVEDLWLQSQFWDVSLHSKHMRISLCWREFIWLPIKWADKKSLFLVSKLKKISWPNYWRLETQQR